MQTFFLVFICRPILAFIGYSLRSSCRLLQRQTSQAKEPDEDPSWHLHTSLYSEVEIGMDGGHSD